MGIKNSFTKKGTREMKPHKHAELIKAWADGAEIEFSESLYGDWIPTKQPEWSEKLNYRIKPEPKPDVISYVFCTKGGTLAWKYYQIGDANLKLTFDGETGELKDAEVIK